MIIELLVTLLLTKACKASVENKPECHTAELGLDSTDSEAFEKGLQEVLDHECFELLPRIKEMLVTGSAPAPFLAASTLALSGRKEYGPPLLKMYLQASEGRSKIPNFPNSLRNDVLLACSDLPRGKDIRRDSSYVKGTPELYPGCVNELRSYVSGKCDNLTLAYDAMVLLQETSTPSSLDVIEGCYKAKDGAVREQAAIALQNLPLDIQLPLLLKAIEDPSEGVRFQAARLMSDWSDERIVSVFQQRLGTETDEPTRRIMSKYLESEFHDRHE